ncbi:MAG: hypothetical protein KBD19_04215 [Candidatus Moranbacteria bacterium]|nr:hypothetical protein [Candidatus Moranbacteria bacterium]
MQNKNNSSINPDNPKRTSFLVKVFAFLFCIIFGIAVAHYDGAGDGIIFGVGLWAWIYYNVLKYRPKTKGDILHEQEMRLQRNLFRPYLKKVIYFFLIVGIGNVALYLVTREPGLLGALGMVIFVLFLLFFSRIRNNASKESRQLVASEMGFAFSQTDDILSVHEKLRTLGQEPRITNVFSGIIEGYPVRIFDFYYKWMKKASYEATLLEITNSRRCPNMLILSKSDAFGETFDATRFSPGVSVRLEGDFSNHFALFVENYAEDEIRQFLTPDLMVALIDTMPDLSFMFFDDKVYVVLSNKSEHGFLKDHFVEQVNKARFIITKWSLTLSKISLASNRF